MLKQKKELKCAFRSPMFGGIKKRSFQLRELTFKGEPWILKLENRLRFDPEIFLKLRGCTQGVLVDCADYLCSLAVEDSSWREFLALTLLMLLNSMSSRLDSCCFQTID